MTPLSLLDLMFIINAHKALSDIGPYSVEYRQTMTIFRLAANGWLSVTDPQSEEYAALEDLIEISLGDDFLRDSIIVQLDDQLTTYIDKIKVDVHSQLYTGG